MKGMVFLFLYILAFLALMVSFLSNRRKTQMALVKAWKSFEGILPQFLAIIFIIGMMLSIISPQQITQLIGKESGWIGVIAAAVIGAVTLIPGFVAFPLVAALLHNGAGYMQAAAFVSTLMMVGVVTIPLEISYFGKRAAWMRNAMAFVFSLLVAAVVGGLMK